MSTARRAPILVAESDFLTGTLLVAAIEATGRRAIVARDGQRLLELIDAHAPELLVISMNLAAPGGVQMLRTLRQKNARPRVIATIREGQANLRASARLLGVSAFLELPFAPDELDARIEGVLSEAS